MTDPAPEYFDEWFAAADRKAKVFQLCMDQGQDFYKECAFHLHQTAETYLHTYMLVYTGYRPKQHDLKKLLYSIAALDTRFRDTIPLSSNHERLLFEKLRRAYVEARYDKNYKVSQEDLLGMAAAVQRLRDTTDTACRDHLSYLQSLGSL